MGFDKRILDNNAAYLDGWIAVLKENPKFIISVMADVNKASDMILDAVDRQKLALGETPILDKNKGHMEDKAQIVSFEDAAIIKKKNGEYAVRASYQGMELGMKPIDKETGVRYFLMPEGKEKEKLLTETLSSKYAHDVSNIVNRANRNLKIG